MKKIISIALSLGLLFCLYGVNLAQQPDKEKKKSTKPKQKKETVITKEREPISDSLKQEMELHRGLLLRDTTTIQ